MTNLHRLSAGVGVRDVLPGIDLDLMGGGMFESFEQFGDLTAASVEAYWVGAGVTWRFGRGSCRRLPAPNNWRSQSSRKLGCLFSVRTTIMRFVLGISARPGQLIFAASVGPVRPLAVTVVRAEEPFFKFLDDLCDPCCAQSARDPYEERIETDRHDFTQSTKTVGRGVVQFEGGYTFFYKDTDEDRDIAHDPRVARAVWHHRGH